MELPLHFHPAELKRKWNLFWHNFIVDFDLRFPEGRRRRLIELALETPDQTLPNDPQLEEFRRSKSQIALVDWPILFEWNERWQQIRSQVLVHQALNNSDYRLQSGTSKVTRVILKRLSEIETMIRAEPLEAHPPLLDLFQFRWKFGALREEADYLVDRLRQTIAPQKTL